MDLRRLRAGEWIAAISGTVLVVSLFLPWYMAGDADVSAFEAYAVVDVLLLGTGMLGIALLVVTAVQRTAAVGVASDALLALVAGIVVIVAAIRAANVPGGLEASGADRAAFHWIGLVAAAGVLVGAVIAMRDERLSKPGARTDATGVPVDRPPEIETLPAPPRGSAES
jgi:hypothetical protein